MASDRPNAADVLWQSWEDCGEIGRCSAEALRDAVNAGPDDIVCLLPDGTLSVAKRSEWCVIEHTRPDGEVIEWVSPAREDGNTLFGIPGVKP